MAGFSNSNFFAQINDVVGTENCFYMNTNIKGDFEIRICVPLSDIFIEYHKTENTEVCLKKV